MSCALGVWRHRGLGAGLPGGARTYAGAVARAAVRANEWGYANLSTDVGG